MEITLPDVRATTNPKSYGWTRCLPGAGETHRKSKGKIGKKPFRSKTGNTNPANPAACRGIPQKNAREPLKLLETPWRSK